MCKTVQKKGKVETTPGKYEIVEPGDKIHYLPDGCVYIQKVTNDKGKTKCDQPVS